MLHIKFDDTVEQNLISVIVPIYNVAPYLEECLDSIINQTYKRLQVVLVDDGSTDESVVIAKNYLNDNRVQLISVENGGVSKARNIGLELARGEYIYFIDSDDCIASTYLEEMLFLMEQYNVDLVCNDHIVYFDNKYNCEYIPMDKHVQVLTPNKQNVITGGIVCRCLLRKTLLDFTKIKFIEGKRHEDEGFMYMIYPFLRRYVRYRGVPYYYRQRKGSFMYMHKSYRNYDYIDIFKLIYLFYKENKLLEKFNPPYRFVLDCAIRYDNEKEYRKRSKEAIKELGVTIPVCEKIRGFLKLIKSRLRYYGFIR